MSNAPDLTRAVAILTENDPPRVWSFVVTVFGDLAQREGDALSGRLLARMADVAGLRPETVRVALHRLRKDGWIDSHRVGRRSDYTLTAFGRAQSAAAAPRIYSDRAPETKEWTVLLANPSEPAAALAEVANRTNAVLLGDAALLVPNSVDEIDNGLLRICSGEVDIPDWVRALAGPEEIKIAYRGLHGRLQRAEPLLPDRDTSLVGATTRVLIVHSWRRVLLRHPDLPAALLPEDWPGEQCRRVVADLLSRLPRPVLDTLETLAAD